MQVSVVTSGLAALSSHAPALQDTITTPIRLTCNHIFCDACISTWLGR